MKLHPTQAALILANMRAYSTGFTDIWIRPDLLPNSDRITLLVPRVINQIRMTHTSTNHPSKGRTLDEVVWSKRRWEAITPFVQLLIEGRMR